VTAAEPVGQVNSTEMRLEDLLVQEGVAVPADELRRVLDGAAESGRHAVVALVEEDVIGEDVLAEVLARACSTVVVDLDRPLDVGAAQQIEKALALAQLALPVSSSAGGKLRVAFANPLDKDAREEIEEAVGAPIQPLVGTLSGLRKAIEQAYRSRTTRVVKNNSDIAPEITRRMQVPSKDKTAPLHRLEREATIEQRHEALLLALVERGVLTRADYMEALKRLLSGRHDE